MPRAKDNRKAVGTEHCSECGTTARFYQVQKGNRLGYLYRRCECGADQRSGAAVQVRWLKKMNPTAEELIPHPLQSRADEPVVAVEQNPSEPQSQSEVDPEPGKNRAGFVGLCILIGGITAALMT